MTEPIKHGIPSSAAAGGPREDRLSPEEAAMIAGAVEPVQPEPEQAARIKARILAGVRAEPRPLQDSGAAPGAPDRRQNPGSPPDHSGFLTVRVQDRHWEQVAPGVEMCVLMQDESRRSILLRMQPESFLLPHHHEMAEESVILEGDAWVGDDVYLTAGDYHFSPAGATHPILQSPKGCVVFVRGERAFHPRITTGLVKRVVRDLRDRIRAQREPRE